MKQKEIEARKYACDCRHDDGINPTFDSYDAQQMRECGFMRGYEAALTNQWINIKKERPKNGAHCFVKKRELNDSKQWQWNYGIAEFIAPTLKNQIPIFRIFDMIVRLEDITHWMLIPKE